jgi:3-dehydroquinate synthase
LASDRGLLLPADAGRITNLLRRLNLPVTWSGLDAAKTWRLMQHDKKNRLGRVRMILPTGLGHVEMYDDIALGDVRKALKALEKS